MIRNFPLKVVCDTGPLADVALALYYRQERWSWKRILNSGELFYIQSEKGFTRLTNYLGRARVVSNAYVATEIDGIAKRILKSEKRLKDFWQANRLLFERIREETEPIHAMMQDEESTNWRFGLPDVSLIRLARKTQHSLLSGDGKLLGICRKRGIGAVNVWAITSAE